MLTKKIFRKVLNRPGQTFSIFGCLIGATKLMSNQFGFDFWDDLYFVHPQGGYCEVFWTINDLQRFKNKGSSLAYYPVAELTGNSI